MAASIAAANEKILKLLTDAGENGLHIDDIMYLLGYNAKKEFQPRLWDLKNRKLIQDLPEGKWRACNKSSLGMNGNHEYTQETFIAPSLQDAEALPKINLPGSKKFSSYKNSLQEFCQKKRYAVPSYKSARESNGLIGSVSFSLNHVKSQVAASSGKEAESRAAFQALRQLGYLKDATFEFPSKQLKSKDVAPNVASAKQSRLSNKEPASFKSRLNELSQKKQLSVPTYDAVVVSGGFFATVTFNGNQYKALKVCKKRKDSEQNAAAVALNALIGTPLPSAEEAMVLGESDVNAMVSEARDAAQPLSLKNRLQEYCQRMSKEMPVYESKRDEATKGHHQSIVTVQGSKYSGQSVKGKKNAENSAAEAALKSLGLMA